MGVGEDDLGRESRSIPDGFRSSVRTLGRDGETLPGSRRGDFREEPRMDQVRVSGANWAMIALAVLRPSTAAETMPPA